MGLHLCVCMCVVVRVDAVSTSQSLSIPRSRLSFQGRLCVLTWASSASFLSFFHVYLWSLSSLSPHHHTLVLSAIASCPLPPPPLSLCPMRPASSGYAHKIPSHHTVSHSPLHGTTPLPCVRTCACVRGMIVLWRLRAAKWIPRGEVRARLSCRRTRVGSHSHTHAPVCVCVCVADNKVLLAREGAVPVLLAVLKQHMTNADVAQAACTALQNISNNGLCLG